jgi:hypothetical protein
MPNIKSVISTLIIAGIIAVGTSYIFAWTEAPAVPPQQNVSAPLNVSSLGQSKISWLWIDGWNDTNRTEPLIRSLVVQQGQVEIGTTTATTSLALAVNGKVGSTNYCDIYGLNCVTPAQLAGSTAGSGQVVILNSLYGLGSISSTWNAAEESTPPYGDQYSKSWTLEQLKAYVSPLNSETRDIAGLILGYKVEISGPTASQSKWYKFNLIPSITNLAGALITQGPTITKDVYYATSNSNNVSPVAVDSGNMFIYDVSNQDYYAVSGSTFLNTYAARPADVLTTVYFYMYGYILR